MANDQYQNPYASPANAAPDRQAMNPGTGENRASRFYWRRGIALCWGLYLCLAVEGYSYSHGGVPIGPDIGIARCLQLLTPLGSILAVVALASIPGESKRAIHAFALIMLFLQLYFSLFCPPW